MTRKRAKAVGSSSPAKATDRVDEDVSDQLYGFNICNTYRNSKDLILYLNRLHNDIMLRDQDLESTPEGFRETIQYLVSTKLLDSSEKKIRLLVAACLVDVFRIYAPELPYKDQVMLKIFDMIIAQIGLLPVAPVGSDEQKLVIYLLRSLAQVKSCVIPVIMAQRGVENALETVQSLFRALIDSIRADHNDEIFTFCVDIMHFCIVEYEGIPDEWVDILLLPLLPASKEENAAAYKLVCFTLRSVSLLPVVQHGFAQLVHDILVNPSKNRETEIIEDIYTLIYELHIVQPLLLSGIIPTITALLKVEADDIRTEVVRLLSKLYSSQICDYTKQFEREFREFCLRINDRLFQIRTEMVDTFVSLIQLRPDLKDYLEDQMRIKLRDPEEEIRQHALTKLLELAQFDLLSLSQETYSEICERVKDKKLDVRKLALIGLSKLYFRHISSTLSPLSSLEVHGNRETFGIPESVWTRLSAVPTIVLRSWGYPDFPTKHIIVHLLQEYLLPKSVAVGRESEEGTPDEESLSETRATALLLLFRCMREEVDRKSLGAVLNFKGRVAEELSHFISLKNSKSEANLELSLSSNASAGELERIAEMKRSLMNLTLIIPFSDKKPTAFDRLISTKDKSVMRMLSDGANATVSVKTALKNKEELQKRLDSKSSLGEYMGVIYDFAGHLFFDKYIICHLFRALIDPPPSVNALEVAEMLSFAAKFSSKAFVDTAELFSSWLTISIPDAGEKGRTKKLKETLFDPFVISAIAASRWFPNDDEKLNFTESLIEASKRVEEPYICLKLGEILCHLAFVGNSSEKNRSYASVAKFIHHLCHKKVLNVQNDRLAETMCLLSALLRIPPISYEKAESIASTSKAIHEALSSNYSHLIHFLYDELFVNSSASVEAKSVGLRIAANIICCEEEYDKMVGKLTKSGDATTTSAVVQSLVRLMELIFECISYEGKIFAGVEIDNEEDQAQLLEASAIDGILLSRVNEFSTSITVTQWQELAWVIVKADRQMKRQLLEYLTNTIQIHPVHLRFLALPCLFANDPELAEPAQKSLVFAIKRLRRTHEEISSQLVTETNEEARERLKIYSQCTTPEIVLPYLLYLLSYHPDFPSSMIIDSDEDKRKVKEMVKCVQMLITSLQQTLRHETSNLPFLFKQLNTIIQRYVDREDADNIGVHFAIRLTLKMLTEQVKTSDNVQLYPKEIPPPEELFVETEAGRTQKLLDRVATQKGSAAIDADAAIEKALHAAQKSNKRTVFTSPTRATSGGLTKSHPSPSEKNAKRKNEKVATKKIKLTTTIVEEVPMREMPRRQAKAATSYTEVDEDDSEVERWNEDAGKKPSRRSSSASQPPRNSLKSTSLPVDNAKDKKVTSSPTTTTIRKLSESHHHDDLTFDLDLFQMSTTSDKKSRNSNGNGSSQPRSEDSIYSDRRSLSKRKLSNGKITSTISSPLEDHEKKEEEDENSTDDLFEEPKKTNKRKNSSSADNQKTKRQKSNDGKKSHNGESDRKTTQSKSKTTTMKNTTAKIPATSSPTEEGWGEDEFLFGPIPSKKSVKGKRAHG